jgi:hypothetical protein
MGRIVVRGTRDNPKVFADYYDVDGTRRTRLIRGAKTRSEGKKRLAEIEARVAAGKPGMEVDEAPPAADPGDQLCGGADRPVAGGVAEPERSRRPNAGAAGCETGLGGRDASRSPAVAGGHAVAGQDEEVGLVGPVAAARTERLQSVHGMGGGAGARRGESGSDGAAGQAATVCPKEADGPWLREEKTFERLFKALPSPSRSCSGWATAAASGWARPAAC